MSAGDSLDAGETKEPEMLGAKAPVPQKFAIRYRIFNYRISSSVYLIYWSDIAPFSQVADGG